MTAASCSTRRSALAKSLGLGQVQRKAEVEFAAAHEPETAKKPHARKAKEPMAAE